jgi:hypothetical protein
MQSALSISALLMVPHDQHAIQRQFPAILPRAVARACWCQTETEGASRAPDHETAQVRFSFYSLL